MRRHLQTRNRRRKGSLIIEAAIGYGVMMMIALLMFKATRTVTSTQQWTVVQTMTDAFMTQETATGSRVTFEDVVSGTTMWPTYPTINTQTVIIGRLPGGSAVTATLHRTKHPDGNNLITAGGSGTEASNPAGMEAWQLESYLVYKVGERDYVKSRTMTRVR